MDMARPSPVRDRLQARRTAGSRQEILDATRAVLARTGVARLTLEAVARELGITKQALYHYFSSKDALLFELVYAEMAAAAAAVHVACEAAPDGASALEALIRTYVAYFGTRLDAYRLVTQHVQQADTRALTPELAARIRPLNDLTYGAAEAKLLAHRPRARGRGHDRTSARRLVFAAHLAAQGMLGMKSLVERFEDPLRYSDDELVDELCRVFRAGAEQEGYA